jgi:hypothetical protein
MIAALPGANVIELVESDSGGRADMSQPQHDPTTRWLGIAMVIFALAIVGLLVFRAVQIAKSP